MMLLQMENITYDIQDRKLFDIKQLSVHSKERIGLIGRNGSGKTTLLQMIAGKISVENGVINAHTSIGFVPQLKRINTTKSGGEITQAYLQEAFNKESGLLMLDEPTNNLDTKHVDWLEERLQHYPGALIIVSHDRAFLNKLCTSIWEIEEETVQIYAGNYDDYAEEREKKKLQEQTAYEKYALEKRQLEEAMRKKEERAQRATKKPKNLSSSEARQKGSKPYYANKQKKLRKSVSAFETRLEQLDRVEKPKERKAIHMDVVHDEQVKNKVIIRGEQVSGKVGNRSLWKPIDFIVRGGDKIAIIGDNGAGKTTLLKQMKENNPSSISIAPSVRIGYFAQNLTILDEKKTILENIQTTSTQDETLIRTVLAQMDIMNDDVYKEVKVLSGGEKVKVSLAKIFLSDANVLILDEPTNYLDIYALEALENLMQAYAGTIIFVTHDRTFTQKVANRIFHIENEKIYIFDGSYQAYKRHIQATEKSVEADQLMVIETKLTDVLSRLSIEPTDELEEAFQALLQEKKQLKKK